jgi:hypothetical protein
VKLLVSMDSLQCYRPKNDYWKNILLAPFFKCYVAIVVCFFLFVNQLLQVNLREKFVFELLELPNNIKYFTSNKVKKIDSKKHYLIVSYKCKYIEQPRKSWH